MNLFDFFQNDILSSLTFFPLLGALILLLFPKNALTQIRAVALTASLAPLIFVIRILTSFDAGSSGLQFSAEGSWIPALNVNYVVGVDGLSISMVLLVSIIIPLTVLGSLRRVGAPEENRAGAKTFFALILLEQTGLYGAFTALNFFHWFIFWEASLVPLFFLIKLYGNEDRTTAAYQFFVYTFIGSVAMVIGMQFVYLATGSWDFKELATLAHTPHAGGTDSELVFQLHQFAATLGSPFLASHVVSFIFFLVLIGFAVKVPLWPFHTWLPSSYTQAPTAGSMILTGLMSKMGVYGFLRVVLPIFGPSVAQYSQLLTSLAVITIIFGALAAFSQRDLKTLVAYSSVSHLGYCLLGLFAIASLGGGVNDRALALNGVLVQMFAHGLSAAGLFYFVGLIEDRTGTRDLADLGGLRKSIPVFCGVMGIVLFASLGLPGLAGFVGEFMIFRGSFPLSMTLCCIAVLGLLLTALYLLRMMDKVFFGPRDDKWSQLKDLSKGELFVGGLLAASLFVVGMMPAPLIALSNSSVTQLAKLFS